VIKIPIENLPAQSFTLTLENVLVDFTITYNESGNYFTFSISSNTFKLDGLKLVSGIRLLKGLYTLKGDLVVINSAEYDNDAKMGTWDNQTELFYFSESEIAELK
jgi:hypothetical protein